MIKYQYHIFSAFLDFKRQCTGKEHSNNGPYSTLWVPCKSNVMLHIAIVMFFITGSKIKNKKQLSCSKTTPYVKPNSVLRKNTRCPQLILEYVPNPKSMEAVKKEDKGSVNHCFHSDTIGKWRKQILQHLEPTEIIVWQEFGQLWRF